jgi:hypothetical protein
MNRRGRVSKRILTTAIAIAVLVAVLVVAWIKGGTRPTGWIETPVAVPAGVR